MWHITNIEHIALPQTLYILFSRLLPRAIFKPGVGYIAARRHPISFFHADMYVCVCLCVGVCMCAHVCVHHTEAINI